MEDGEDGDGRFSLVLVTNKSIREYSIILVVFPLLFVFVVPG